MRESTCCRAFSFCCREYTSTCCTGRLLALARAAATPADSPMIMYCGSIRTEAIARALPEMHTGTSRFWHSSNLGTSERYGISYCATGMER